MISMALFKLQPKIYGAWQQEELVIILNHDVNAHQNPHEILFRKKEFSKEKLLLKKVPK